ncbi:MAG TPA: dephospho-CoA kinase [Verrucomicrobiae bacterium]|jgi:dephospho-CoA kinase|nr:dephospho-CoA kinase [Verrucomicrobiae bacterium]
MLRVGLTGGIACGKSTVGQMLVARGAHYLSADELAHQLYAPGAEVYDAVVDHFGREIINSDGTVNRKKLASIVFPARIGELNAIVHPAVVAAQKRWMAGMATTNPDGIAVVEAALLLEAGAQKDFDKILVVTCDLERKVQRYAQRMGLPVESARAEVARRGAVQMSDQQKSAAADYVIDNSRSLEDTERQVGLVWAQLQDHARSRGTGSV